MKITQFKRLAAMLLLVAAMVMPSSTWAQSTITLSKPSGDGSSASPYQIGTPEELYWFAALVNGKLTDGTSQNTSACAVLVSDITVNTDLLNSLDENGDPKDNLTVQSWTPIGYYKSSSDYIYYKGTFDGNGYSISGLYVKYTNQGEASFIGDIGDNEGGCVKNIAILDSYFEGSQLIGGIVGYLNKGIINNCLFSGTVKSQDKVGGICGAIQGYSTISDCFSNAKILVDNADNYCGGICGQGWSSVPKLRNCVYNGSLYSGQDIKWRSSAGTVEHVTSMTTAEIASGKATHWLNRYHSGDGLGWYQNIDNGETKDAYPVLDNTHGVVYTSQPCPSSGNFSNNKSSFSKVQHSWGENNVCTQCGKTKDVFDLVEGFEEPSQVGGVYQISTAGELYWFTALVNGNGLLTDGTPPNNSANAVLTSDITVNSNVLDESGNLAETSDTRLDWIPIGNSDRPYTGTFNGQGYTISGLYFKNSSKVFVGLFGKFYGKIQNTGVIDSYFEGDQAVGGLCGTMQGEMKDCFSRSFVKGRVDVGGVCGDVSGGKVENAYQAGIVCGSSETAYNVNGIFGGIYYNATSGYSQCSNCYYDTTLCPNMNACGSTSSATNVEGRPTTEFASGEVAYLLNNSVSDGAWGQTIGTDPYPVLGGLPVYYRDEVYTNTYGILTIGTQTITTSNEPPIWYEFTPEADGNYRFSSKTILGSICVNTEMTINNMQSMSYSPSYGLSAKTTYYVYLYYAPGEYDLTIEKLNSTLKTGDNEIIVSTTGKLWYEFTPTETGSYQFSSTDLEGGYLYVVKNKNTTDDSRYIPYAPVYELTADNIYYVAVSYAPGTYALTIKKLDTTLEVGTNEFEVSAPRVWYEFTSTETGSYQFSSTQLTAGNLYVNTTKTESDYTDITTSPTYDLEAATTYYVAVNYAPGSYDLTITRINNTPTAMEAVTAPQIYAVDGRIVCEGEFRIYDLLGRDVTRLNGSLNGVYVVKTANAAVKVVVR
ncbi:MAG: hypothetical protein PUE55_06960 [Bacteroidales bacterium]|nr:hypothetical protein [Bacteroidales bacterium]